MKVPDGEERQGQASDSAPLPHTVQVYPNPTNQAVLYVQCPDLIGEQLHLEMVNPAGQTIRRTDFQNTGSTILPIGNVPDGAYWLRLSHSSRVVYSGKIVVLH